MIIRILLLLCLFLGFPNRVKSQNVFLADNYSSSKILIHEVTDKRNADLFVFKSLRRVLNRENDGIWHFTSYPTYSHKNIYFIVSKKDHQGNKNIINIYYVKSQFLAGWRNFDKIHLMQ
tara:strand:+ start:440 stop:796 length:357 start_codon:yes stop_codon:yes gene_type:complete